MKKTLRAEIKQLTLNAKYDRDYHGDEKWLSKLENSLLALVDNTIEEVLGEDVPLRGPNDHLPSAYQYLKGKNELRAEARARYKEKRG